MSTAASFQLPGAAMRGRNLPGASAHHEERGTDERQAPPAGKSTSGSRRTLMLLLELVWSLSAAST